MAYKNYENGMVFNAKELNDLQELIKADTEKRIEETMKLVFPVGSTYITQEDTNPSEILGFGTWERFKGLVALGVDEDDEDLNEIGKTGGKKTNILDYTNLPNELMYDAVMSDKASDGEYLCITSGSAGRGWKTTNSNLYSQPLNNLQPYEIVGYMWIRRA